MLIGFLDDTEIVVDSGDSNPDVFAFGGYFIRHDQLDDLQERIAEVKTGYDLPWYAPVKWNLRDRGLREFYTPGNLLDPALADHLLRVSNPLRRDLLALLSEFDATVLISGRYDDANRPATNSDYYTWAFENLLQRIGLMAEGMHTRYGQTSSTTLVVDWPQRGVDKQLFDVYQGGYHVGRGLTTSQNYYSGALRNLRFYESLLHGSTLHSGPLQLADLVVGCSRDFLTWAFKDTNIQKILGRFELLIPQFYRDASGRLDGCGIKVARANNLDIEAKINEYLAQNQPSQVDEIPF